MHPTPVPFLPGHRPAVLAARQGLVFRDPAVQGISCSYRHERHQTVSPLLCQGGSRARAETLAVELTQLRLFEGTGGDGEARLPRDPDGSATVLSRSRAVATAPALPAGCPWSAHSTVCLLYATSPVYSIAAEAATNRSSLSPCLPPHRPCQAPAPAHPVCRTSLAGTSLGAHGCDMSHLRNRPDACPWCAHRGCCCASRRACRGTAPRQGRQGRGLGS